MIRIASRPAVGNTPELPYGDTAWNLPAGHTHRRIMAQNDFKRDAAEHAVALLVRSGMTVGLGTGSTAIWATRRLGALLREGTLRDITAVATSKQTWDEAHRLGIPLLDGGMPRDLDLTIDGADEVDPEMNLIKGGGGALLREKIVAQASRRVVIVIDDSKRSPRLGTRVRVPVEVTRFGWQACERFLQSLGARTTLRLNAADEPFLTDEGHWIIDCDFGPLAAPHTLAHTLEAHAGIVEHGLFLRIATDLVVAGPNGLAHETCSEASDFEHIR
jgi:ribose 5-phosphate isomerase A